MKKRENSRRHFYKNPKKQYLTKIRFFPSFLSSSLDKWLSEMSLQGWHIVYCGWLRFVFEKGEKKQRIYFSLCTPDMHWKDSIDLLHPFWRRRYGKHPKKSRINASENPYRVTEIDYQKFDEQDAIGFRELLNDRHRVSKRYLFRDILILLMLVVGMVLFFFSF